MLGGGSCDVAVKCLFYGGGVFRGLLLRLVEDSMALSFCLAATAVHVVAMLALR